jgi:hypothetical protein
MTSYALIQAIDAEHVGIRGKGVIDGDAWRCRGGSGTAT